MVPSDTIKEYDEEVENVAEMKVPSSSTTSSALQSQENKSRRVYVGNISWNAQWQDLKDHMRKRGGHVVRADIFVDSEGYSYGCGLVEYETPEEARDAIEHLTDTELLDRKIFVREDREPPPRQKELSAPRRGRGTRGARPRENVGYHIDGPGPNDGRFVSENAKDRQIFVGNLPYKVKWQDLKDLFNQVGVVVRADVHEYRGRPRGSGTVLFAKPEDAQAAIEKFNDYKMMERKIFVRLDNGQSSYKWRR